MRFPKKKYFLFTFFILILCYICLNYKITTNDHNKEIKLEENKINEEPNLKIEEVKQPVKIDSQNEKNNRVLLAYDSGGFGPVSKGITKCSDGIEVEITDDASRLDDADFSYHHMQVPPKRSSTKKRHYYMVFTLESEPHSYGGESWDTADFRMWYNLDGSFPEPATYFEVKTHLVDLLSPSPVSFENKTKDAPIVWIVSNCNAYNGREKYLSQLMKLVKIDSYGGCMKNKFTHPSEHMKGNIELFSQYKFVIAIENSNCVDYVTEKLVHAIASGSIPIIAGRDNKPNYLKFLPKNSYINIYDYKSPKELADRINQIASNQSEYESYLAFKRNHKYTRDYLKTLSLKEIINLSKTIIDPNEIFFSELVLKEKSENKVCKVARYILNTKDDLKEDEISKRKMKRPAVNEACLPSLNLFNDLITKN